MTTATFTPRRLNVPAFVTAAVAAWFVFASGTALADTTRPDAASAQNPVTLTPEGRMKLTVVAQRPQASRVQTAGVRGASQG